MAPRPNRSRASNTPAPAAAAAPAAAPAQTQVIEIDVQLLSEVIEATNDAERGYLSIDPVQASLMAQGGLVVVNRGMIDEAGNIATKATFPAATTYVATHDDGSDQEGDTSDSTSNWTAPAANHAQTASTVSAAASASTFEIDDGIPLPKMVRNTVSTAPKYPFDVLNVGQSFHVAKSTDIPDPKRTLASTVSVVNIKHSFPLKDESGNVIIEDQSYNETQRDPVTNVPLKDANGNVIVKRIEKTGPKLGYTKKFRVATVDKNDKRGEGARVFRIQ